MCRSKRPPNWKIAISVVLYRRKEEGEIKENNPFKTQKIIWVATK